MTARLTVTNSSGMADPSGRSPGITSTSTTTATWSGRAAKGALTGAAMGLLLGPPGFAVGMAAGAIAGGVSESDSAPIHHDALLDAFRVEIPESSLWRITAPP
jgi:uncharacterized membrane protein